MTTEIATGRYGNAHATRSANLEHWASPRAVRSVKIYREFKNILDKL